MSQIRSPDYKFGNRVRKINYGDCYYFLPVTLRDLDRVNADAACAHFSQAFRNPAEFTVCLTGTLDVRGPLATYYTSCTLFTSIV